ncbi:MAG: Stp1/IreP family PP2C-type Ser/Thr phosphatase [Gammaproteobacteria bacterium]|nr:Stp1/IreP family PP2C-type Ser/Thr phosphatase [Gammaproteobacteria bacterium]
MISANSKLVIHGLSDVGLVRGHNEDKISWDINLGLVLLADGMGGHNAGEVASEIAVNSITDFLRNALIPQPSDDVDYMEIVSEAVKYANIQIIRTAAVDQECAGMGTTVVLALFHHDSIVLAHVGDSRIYCYRGGVLSPITRDHSLVQEMLDNGFLNQEEALTSTNRNLITRALGIAETVDVDVIERDACTRDVYLLCSDGLTDLVNDSEIAEILGQHINGDDVNSTELEAIVTSLVSCANERGGKDNISIVLVTKQEAYSDSIGLDE